jgi:hypothetical protein
MEFIYSFMGSTMENVFHVKKPDAWSDSELLQLVNIGFTWWVNNLNDYQSDELTLIRVEARDLSTEFAPFATNTPLSGNAGLRESPPMPANVTLAIKWASALTGRSTRGRTYHIGLTEDQVEGQTINDVQRTGLINAYNQLRSDINSFDSTWVLSVLSRVQDGVPLAEAIAYEIASVTADEFIDSMRRRLAGRGT